MQAGYVTAKCNITKYRIQHSNDKNTTKIRLCTLYKDTLYLSNGCDTVFCKTRKHLFGLVWLLQHHALSLHVLYYIGLSGQKRYYSHTWFHLSAMLVLIDSRNFVEEYYVCTQACYSLALSSSCRFANLHWTHTVKDSKSILKWFLDLFCQVSVRCS